MTNTPNLFLMQYIIDIGEGVAPENLGPEDWPVVAGPLPDDGDRFIGIMDLPATTDGRAKNTVARFTHPQLQVIVRGPNYDTAGKKAMALQNQFDKVGIAVGNSSGVGWVPVTVDGERIVITSLYVNVPAFPIGMEKDNSRYLFAFHAQLDFRE